MEELGDMKFYTFEEIKDEIVGKTGTPERDNYERRVREAVGFPQVGEAIKAQRIKQNLTQQQLGDRIGVQRAQISRIEKGNNLTLPTIRRVFRALGIESATLDLGAAGRIALW